MDLTKYLENQNFQSVFVSVNMYVSCMMCPLFCSFDYSFDESVQNDTVYRYV